MVIVAVPGFNGLQDIRRLHTGFKLCEGQGDRLLLPGQIHQIRFTERLAHFFRISFTDTLQDLFSDILKEAVPARADLKLSGLAEAELQIGIRNHVYIENIFKITMYTTLSNEPK